MSLETLKELIELYNVKLEEWRQNRGKDSERRNIIEEFSERAIMISGVEDEILYYFNESTETKRFNKPIFLWFIAATECPSSKYINSLLTILRMKGLTVEASSVDPYWKVLDLLQYMPEKMTEMIVPEILEIIEQANPSWSNDVMAKAFELVHWIAPADVEKNFIWRLSCSSNERLADNAKQWREWIEQDENEDE